MPAFGENLRREREMRGVSLEEIASFTKISRRFLEAIEEDDFARLPGGIFARSFIRSYVRYLGLDEDRVMAEYQLAARPQEDVDLHWAPTSKSVTPRPVVRAPLVATLVGIILFSGGYALYHYSRRVAETPPPPAPSPVATPSPAAAAAQPIASTNPTALPAGVNPPAGGTAPGTIRAVAASVPGAPAAGESLPTQAAARPAGPPSSQPTQDADLVLQVAATERSWVAVDADGKAAFQRVMDPNEVKTVKARDSFDVTAGNAQGIILTLNGETLRPLGRRGEVKSVHITREDLKSSAP
jgi:cytoskeletal protein RodZ